MNSIEDDVEKSAIIFDNYESGDQEKLIFENLPDGMNFAQKYLFPQLFNSQSVISSFHENLDYVLHLRDNKNGNIAAVTSAKTIKIYDASLCFIAQIAARENSSFHTEIITDACFIPENPNLIATCGEDGNLFISDIRLAGVVAFYQQKYAKSLYSCCSNGQLIAAGGESTEETGIAFWDLRKNQIVGSFNEVSQEDILSLQFSPSDASKIFSGGEDGIIIEFNLLAGNSDEAFESAINTEQPVAKFGFFDTSKFIYSISQISTLSIWNTESVC